MLSVTLMYSQVSYYILKQSPPGHKWGHVLLLWHHFVYYSIGTYGCELFFSRLFHRFWARVYVSQKKRRFKLLC